MNTSKTLKRTITIISIILIVACSISINAFAAVKPGAEITPLWTNINSISIDMTFYGNEGNVSATASKQSTSNRIEGTMYLYELVNGQWEYIDEVYRSKSVGTLGLSIDFPCVEGVTYKAVLTITAYSGGVGETETVEHIETC